MDFDGPARTKPVSVNSVALIDGLLRVSLIVRLRFNEWLARFELTDGRHAVLSVLCRAGEAGCSQAELAISLAQSESNISTLIERMQRDGLVNRTRSEFDRRKRVLQITTAGSSILAAVDAQRTAWSARLFHGIDLDDQAALLSLLQQLGTGLERNLPESSYPALSVVSQSSGGIDPHSDLASDPQSPQFALRQMLKSLGSMTSNASREKEAA